MYRSIILKSKVNLRTGIDLFRKRFSTIGQSSLSELGRKSLVFTESDGYIMKSPYEPITIPDFTIDQYVWKNLPKWQNHVAIVCGITGRKYTYAKLRDRCAALAIRLRNNLKLEKNDIVAVCLPNIPGKLWKF